MHTWKQLDDSLDNCIGKQIKTYSYQNVDGEYCLIIFFFFSFYTLHNARGR